MPEHASDPARRRHGPGAGLGLWPPGHPSSFGSGPGRCLQQRFGEQILVVPDDQPPTDPAGGGPELTGAAEHVPEQLLIRGPRRLEIVPHDLPSLRDPDLVDALEQLEGSVPFNGVGVGALKRPVLDPMLRKKLLRLVAARSARAVVPPVQRVRHGNPRWVVSFRLVARESRASRARGSTPGGGGPGIRAIGPAALSIPLHPIDPSHTRSGPTTGQSPRSRPWGIPRPRAACAPHFPC